MNPRSWIPLLMLGFIHWSLSDSPERTEIVGEGMSVNIPFNTAERCVQLSRRADSNHAWMKCLVCLENGPLCPEFRNRCSIYLHGLTLHNVSKADAGIYSITPHLNGNSVATNIVHLVVLDRQPSSTQGPPDSPISGTTRREGTASVPTGPMDYHILLGIIVGVIIVGVIVIVIVLKKFGLSQCRRRQSSEPPDSNTIERQPRPAQPNERQVDQARQEQDLLVNGRAQEDEECLKG
ncbi:uncharacterized protein LOC120394783 [Mauremys reevesii]|uniref:uncharacterized protein LOC120394783 n=1 Tax=Mauremys reevesii TaxID=260615 RepID=UPI00193F54DA|nr:uncharacterized protein LOC120394783 [Mauremys reevesii]